MKRVNEHRSTLLIAQARKRKTFKPKHKQHGKPTRTANNLGPRDDKVVKYHKGKPIGKDKSKWKCYNCGKWTLCS